jgi:hypothetical protein
MSEMETRDWKGAIFLRHLFNGYTFASFECILQAYYKYKS